MLKEAKRVLKPHGKIIVSVHSYEHCMPVVEEKSLLIKTGDEAGDIFIKEPNNNICYWHYFTKDELMGHFTEAGIAVLCCGYTTEFGMGKGWDTTMVCIGEKVV